MILNATALADEFAALDKEITPLLAELNSLLVQQPERFDELALILQELIAKRQSLIEQWLKLEDNDPAQGQWIQQHLVNTREYGAQVAELKQFFLDAMHSMKANRTKVDLYKTLESKR
ncbi:hypothetical protein [Shewanella sp.]|uniref:hypothetical protein n=1 Tax=Shewanella sp. TaxID=50422 RepID=UPI003F3C3064